MTTTTKPLGLLLRLNANSFEPINAIRARYPAVRIPAHQEDPQRPLLPFFSLIHALPGSALPTLQARLSNLAALRKPFMIKVGAPRMTGGAISERHAYGFGFEIPVEEIEKLRHEIYEELSGDIKAAEPEQFLTKYSFRPRGQHMLAVRHSKEGLPKEKASEVLRELEREYPNGFGTVVAEGFALQEHVSDKVMRVSEKRMKGEYPFGAN